MLMVLDVLGLNVISRCIFVCLDFDWVYLCRVCFWL